jgi:HK97 family phage major capsid protein
MDKLKQLRDDRSNISAEMRKLKEGVEEKGFNDETQTRWDELTQQIDKVDNEIRFHEDAAKRLADEKRDFHDRGDDRRKESFDDEITAATRSEALRGWLNTPGGRETEKQTEAMRKLGMNPHQKALRFNLAPKQGRNSDEIQAQYRAQSTSNAAGGYLINNELIAAYDEAKLYYCNIREWATVYRTETGASLPIPTSNDTSNKGAILAENTQVSEQDVAFGQETLDAYKFTSKLVRVSYEFLNDAFLNVDQWIGRTLGERIGRIQTQYFTTGTGSSQPEGVTAGAADSGVTLAAAAAITYDELTDIYHAVDPEYRMMPNCGWMLHDTWLKYLRQVKDANGLPIWNPGLGAAPDTILGKAYKINNEMPTATASKVICFGDFSKLVIRDVAMDVSLVRLDERYADYGQVAFVMWERADSVVVDAGTNPIVYATSG